MRLKSNFPKKKKENTKKLKGMIFFKFNGVIRRKSGNNCMNGSMDFFLWKILTLGFPLEWIIRR
jgi:hypothetical protein